MCQFIFMFIEMLFSLPPAMNGLCYNLCRKEEKRGDDVLSDRLGIPMDAEVKLS